MGSVVLGGAMLGGAVIERATHRCRLCPHSRNGDGHGT